MPPARPAAEVDGPLICPSCQFDGPDGMRFCGRCGSPLAAGDEVREPSALPEPLAERRQITVVFCDLVGSTALAERLDPEELREMVMRYHRACSEVVATLEGYVAQYLGDGVLVYFGYPTAHEDDAVRAVHAGLGVVQAVERLNREAGHPEERRFQVRVGVHTGLAVVGAVGEGHGERLATGEVPNVASRVEAQAEPGEVLVSAATARQVSDFFFLESRGAPALRGLSRPLELFRVIAESGVRSRLEAAARRGLTPLVGRREELDRLATAWARALEGEPRTLFVEGEPGLGKSRLVRAFLDRLDGDVRAWHWRCSPHFADTAFYPVTDFVEERLGFRSLAPPARLERLASFLAEEGPGEEELPWWRTLLSVPSPDEEEEGVELEPRELKERTLESLVRWVEGSAGRRPRLLFVHNLHWVDPSTVELLARWVERRPAAPLLLVLTYRPSFEPPWQAASHVEAMRLSRLEHEEIASMVASLDPQGRLPDPAVEGIVRQSDGIPLFVEEMTKGLLETGSGAGGRGEQEALPVPESLQSSLMARLDRLGPARMVAQLGAVIGRSFPFSVLAAVADLPPQRLEGELARLVDAELLFLRREEPDSVYTFKHALIQETAYEALLHKARREYHRRVALALESRGSARPELLAHHFTEAGQVDRAIDLWLEAGEGALGRSAQLEAARHLSRARDLIPRIPESPDRHRRELAIHTLLGPALMATRGFGAPEVAEVYGRARDLCQRLGDAPQLFPVLLGLFRYYGMRADWPTARELGEQLVGMAEAGGRRDQLPDAHRALGAILYHVGELEEAGVQFERGIELYDAAGESRPGVDVAHHPGVNCRIYAALAKALLGFPEQALARHEEALEVSRRLDHPPTLAFALGAGAAVREFRGEPEEARNLAAEGLALSRDQAFPTTLAMCRIFHGWAVAETGEPEAGRAELERGLEAWEKEGAVASRTYYLALLARARHLAGAEAAALEALDEAVRTADENGERFVEPELERLRGELLLAGSGNRAAAIACFRRALELARRRGMLWLELRAAISLVRALAGEARAGEARSALRDVLDRLQEGEGTPPVTAARRLLAEDGDLVAPASAR